VNFGVTEKVQKVLRRRGIVMSITRGFARILFSRVCLFALLLSGSIFSVSAVQGAVAWSPSSGSGDGFVWLNGQSGKGLFGDPTFTDNAFSFEPDDFRADSVNGKSALATDSLQFDILAEDEIQSIVFVEGGNYGIEGTGSVKATVAITIINLDVYEVINRNFEIIPYLADGTWSGSFEVDGINWSHIRITMSNKLIARSSVGSSSFIEKDAIGVNGGVGIKIVTIPEPATIGILAMGSLAISIFGKKKNSRI
jgi:hypothetical protein